MGALIFFWHLIKLENINSSHSKNLHDYNASFDFTAFFGAAERSVRMNLLTALF